MFYHGSGTKGIRLLIPHLSEHGRPYVYFSESPAVAALYTVCPVEKPYNWYPYGYDSDGIPVYTEYYPGALREIYAGRTGYLYCRAALPADCRAECRDRIWMAQKPLPADDCITLPDVHKALLEMEHRGLLRIRRYEELTDAQRDSAAQMLLQEIAEHGLTKKPDCGYSRFLQERFPAVWEQAVIMK